MLPRAERNSLRAIAEPVELVLSEVLCEPHRITSHVYFPVEGFISLVTPINNHSGLEAGMFGREGMLGAQVALGVMRSPFQARVLGPGLAWRLDAPRFRDTMDQSPTLQRVLHRYVYMLMVKLAGASACQRYHSIPSRLARWLLMNHDRAHCAQFHATHESLAYMLGVRRVGVTQAAVGLKRSGVIDYHRGELTVIDRLGLEAFACACYAGDCRTYRDLMECKTPAGA